MNTPASSPTPDSRLSERLKRRLFLYASGALLVLALGVGLSVVATLFHQLKQAEEAGLAHIAETRGLAVGEWYRRALDLSRQVTSRTRIREELAAYNAGRRSLEELAAFTRPKLADAMDLSGEVVGLTRLDRMGRPVASVGAPVPPNLVGDMAGSAPGNAAGPSDDVRFSPPVVPEGRPCMVVAAPILARTGQRVGTDLVVMDIARLLEIIERGRNVRGAGTVCLGYAAGPDIRLFPDGTGRAAAPTPSQAEALRRAVAGSGGILTAGDEVTAYTPAGGAGWGLTVSVNERELYNPLRLRLIQLALYSLLIYAVCVIGLWRLLRPLTGRLLLHASELESEVDAKTATLKSELDARLKAEQALHRAHQELEDRVRERTRELAEANEALQRIHHRLEGEHEQRKLLSRDLINLLEEDRREVARELHDHTGQLLTTLRLDLQAALESLASADGCCKGQLESAADKITLVQRDIKSISKGLRPDTLEYLGLAQALEALLDEYRASTDLDIHFFHKGVPRRFDGQKELALYRITQEALTNTVKYAGARQVHISLISRDGRLGLTIEDDGQGFDQAAVAARAGTSGSLGLTLMKERMVQLEGTFHMESAPGRGTQILAELDIGSANDA
ncbi:integral membrane sensor signal transduction histidine kinase [Pseudodesulfovibrio mercurii]|uniref:Integral membrane sensor signal transduction histidine kinase n=1 Tax=Pseudodesulfovibrio mercurii TaxID=641491 RepID=F0JK67_9BACT|nr:ATP-binding protein [Pseudodesulfovibrio mercurii]EGB16316.1 integral membrane sensor signal transduction histidine kinase [Pseudodesulfovibrio mercurii]